MTADIAPDVAAYYGTHSDYSDPGSLAARFADLPTDLALLARVVRNLLIHRAEGAMFGRAIAVDRLHHDAETRYVDGIVRLLVERDGRSLTLPREVGDRFVGVCRDFALLHCSFLRSAGVPARIRCGFATYLDADLYSDHVVTEYWDALRGWRLADPQMADPRSAAAFGLDFDPMDVPRERFLVAGTAWRAIREGHADPLTFGHWRPEDPLAGEWFVAQSVRLDVAAVNKAEMLLWDIWGTAEDGYRAVSDAQRDLYDRVTEAVADEVDFDAARALYSRDDRLRVPRRVWSLAPFSGPAHVDLRAAPSATDALVTP
ncbi:hypothetical protein ABIA35_006135 [Catenulispora sp. MAP12-49]|uniref:transglutaminase-like domain-containing protein n=1 Tax=Catenulispora sp. MAP12-49 TaxID=3156302 RepID=UPI00351139F6